jgi:hypothetical protein
MVIYARAVAIDPNNASSSENPAGEVTLDT